MTQRVTEAMIEAGICAHAEESEKIGSLGGQVAAIYLAMEAANTTPASIDGDWPDNYEREIGKLVNRILELAPKAGLYIGINITPVKQGSASK